MGTGADFGRIDEVQTDGTVLWTRANRVRDGGWTRGYEVGGATALPQCPRDELEVGDIVPLYRHAGRVFYGPPCGVWAE
jgi:hypothetical protein